MQQDTIAEYDDGRGRSLKEYRAFSGLSNEDLAGPIRVLDIGAGPTTRFATELKAQNPDAVVVSLSPDFTDEVHRAKAVAAGALDAGSVVAGVAQRLPFADKSFDRAVMLFTLTYLPVGKMIEATREMGRVLKPGGKGVASPIILLKNKDSEAYRSMRGVMDRCKNFVSVVEDLQEHDDGAFPNVRFEEAIDIYPDGIADPDVEVLRMIVTPREESDI